MKPLSCTSSFCWVWWDMIIRFKAIIYGKNDRLRWNANRYDCSIENDCRCSLRIRSKRSDLVTNSIVMFIFNQTIVSICICLWKKMSLKMIHSDHMHKDMIVRSKTVFVLILSFQNDPVRSDLFRYVQIRLHTRQRSWIVISLTSGVKKPN